MDEDVAALQSQLRDARNEAADRRVKLKKFRDAFAGWDEASVDYMLGVVEDLGTTHTRRQGYERLAEFTQNGLSAYVENGDEPPPQGEVPVTEENTPDINAQIAAEAKRLAEEQLKEERKKMEEETAAERTRMEIEASARALGYEPNTDGYTLLMSHAGRVGNDEAGNPLPIAEALKRADTSLKNQLIELYEGMSPAPTEEPPSPVEPPTPAPEPAFAPSAQAGGSGAPIEHPDEQKPREWADAREGAKAFLDAVDWNE